MRYACGTKSAASLLRTPICIKFSTSMPRPIRNSLLSLFGVYTLIFLFGGLYQNPFHILIFLFGLFGILALFVGLSRSIVYFILTVCPLLFFIDLTRNPYYTQI